jgi:hypothetical protein
LNKIRPVAVKIILRYDFLEIENTVRKFHGDAPGKLPVFFNSGFLLVSDSGGDVNNIPDGAGV